MALLPQGCIRDDLIDESVVRFKTNAVLWLGQTTNRSFFVNLTDQPVYKPYVTMVNFHLDAWNSLSPSQLPPYTERAWNGGGVIVCQGTYFWETDDKPTFRFTFNGNK